MLTIAAYLEGNALFAFTRTCKTGIPKICETLVEETHLNIADPLDGAIEIESKLFKIYFITWSH